MRSELELIKKIEEYLQNELSEADRYAFEQEIAKNPNLQLEVEQQKILYEGIRTMELKSAISAAANTFWWTQLFKWLGISVGILGTTTAIIYYVYITNTSSPNSNSLGVNQSVEEKTQNSSKSLEPENTEEYNNGSKIDENEQNPSVITENDLLEQEDKDPSQNKSNEKTELSPAITLTINAEDFTDFYDKSPSNLAYDGYIKNIPALDRIYRFKESALDVGIGANDQAYFIGWTDIGEWVEYQPQFKKSAQYELQFFLSSDAKDQKREIEYSINGATPQKLEVPFTGSWDQYEPLSIGTFSFEKESLPKIRITFKTGWVNYKKMVFKEVQK